MNELKKFILKIVLKIAFNAFLIFTFCFLITFGNFSQNFLKCTRSLNLSDFAFSWTKICLRHVPLYFQNVTLGMCTIILNLLSHTLSKTFKPCSSNFIPQKEPQSRGSPLPLYSVTIVLLL